MGHPISYRPFDIRLAMEQTGNVPTSVVRKPKSRYDQADLRRWVARYGEPFERNPDLVELDHRRLLRATLWLDNKGPVDAFATAIFAAMWGRPRPLKTPSDLAAILGISGSTIGG